MNISYAAGETLRRLIVAVAVPSQGRLGRKLRFPRAGGLRLGAHAVWQGGVRCTLRRRVAAAGGSAPSDAYSEAFTFFNAVFRRGS